MTKRRARRLLPSELAAVNTMFAMGDRRMSILRAFMVEGQSAADVAAIHGCTRQNVYDAANYAFQLLDRFLEARQIMDAGASDLPDGWQVATVVAPKALLDRLREDVARATMADAARRKKPGADKAGTG